jgi:hypothetical protein
LYVFDFFGLFHSGGFFCLNRMLLFLLVFL